MKALHLPFVLAAIVTVASGCASTDGAVLREMPTKDIAARFQPCVSPFGVSRAVAGLRTNELPDLQWEIVLLALPPATMSDSFHHTLLVDRAGGRVYIAETGGFAGVKRWYGPIDMGIDCKPGTTGGTKGPTR